MSPSMPTSGLVVIRQGLPVHAGLWYQRCAEAFRGLAGVTTERERKRRKSLQLYAQPVLEKARRGRVRADLWEPQGPGRWHPKHPLLHEITSHYGVRDAVVAAPGHTLVIGDWTSAHAWIAAVLTGDAPLLADLERGDLYDRAARIWAPEVEPRQARRAAKIAVLAVLNGAGGPKLAEKLTEKGVPVDTREASGRKEAWLACYPALRPGCRALMGVRAWETPAGREVVAPDDLEPYKLPAWRWQSIEADALFLTLSRLQWRAVFMVHDSILLEVPEADGERAAQDLRREMDRALREMAGLPAGDSGRTVKVQVHRTWSGVEPETWPEDPGGLIPGAEIEGPLPRLDRRRLASLLGLEIVDGRVSGLDCPRCGEETVGFSVDRCSSAVCPCGWRGGLSALVEAA